MSDVPYVKEVKWKEKAKKEPVKKDGQEKQLRLPGFNLPLNHYEQHLKQGNARLERNHQKFFPNALNPHDIRTYRSVQPLLTLRELSMLRIMNELTEKPDWDQKIFDPTIASKWRSEMISTPIKPSVSPQMAEYIICELKDAARWFRHCGHTVVFNSVVKSDVALPQSFQEKLQEAIRPLEDIPPHLQDWHPGSDGKVLDLVHPSLYPLVYGKTRILEGTERVPLHRPASVTGKGTILPIPTIVSDDPMVLPGNSPYSQRFQWLPCEVALITSHSPSSSTPSTPSTPTTKPVIKSYINNLHPWRHANVYKLVEQVIDAAIPMWDKSLQGVLEKLGMRALGKPTRISYNGVYANGVIQPEPEPYVQQAPPPQTLFNTDSVMSMDVVRDLVFGPSQDVPPPATKASKKKAKKLDREPPPVVVDIRKKFRQHGLQIIVKFANIELTPEKPTYDGGSWHLEGQLNENICASALYYYSSHNITQSKLAFRQQSDTSRADSIAMPDQFLPAIYGSTEEDSGVQMLGSVATPQGRLLVFPNILQHQVQPFALEDPTKKGWRKVLALFLVDPNTRIISTRHVPPQRRDWWVDEMRVESIKNMCELPMEIRDEIFDKLDYPIGMTEAKEFREELMEERKEYEVQYDRSFHSIRFSLCEH